jgi:hypothetical protein
MSLVHVETVHGLDPDLSPDVRGSRRIRALVDQRAGAAQRRSLMDLAPRLRSQATRTRPCCGSWNRGTSDTAGGAGSPLMSLPKVTPTG